MFEITYINKNPLPEKLIKRDKACYDFTFENRYHIYHRPRRDTVEYICYDSKTDLGSRIFEKQTPLVKEEHIIIIPDILKSLRYTGDRRVAGGYLAPENIVDLIFRVIMPRNGYAIRESQLQMAKVLCNGLRSKKVTLCEAEVGSGKTMAYLVAGFAVNYLDQAYHYQGNPVTITTSSIELQKAIMERELPALSNMLLQYGLIHKPLTAVLRKGKEHYFCIHRYYDYMDSLQKCALLYSKTIRDIKALRLEKNGFDLDKAPLSAYIKDRICVNGSCQGCPRAQKCTYARYMESALRPYIYDFQITNHHLFLQAQRASTGGTAKSGLQPFHFCIVDEAHKLPETAIDVFTHTLAFGEVDDYLRSVQYTQDKNPQRRAEYQEHLLKAVRLNNKFQYMFDKYKFSINKEPVDLRFYVTENMEKTLTNLIYTLNKLGRWEITPTSTQQNTAAPLLAKLTAFLAGDKNTYWITYDKATRQKYLVSIPVNPDIHMQNALWNKPNTHYAMTSGTMRDDSGFSFFKREMGIEGYLDAPRISEFTCSSPFRFSQNTRLYISDKVPAPNMDNPRYIPAVAKELVELIRATKGHTVVLFTSYKALVAAHELVAKEITEYPLFMMTRKNRNVISRFKNSGNGVLFASGSMWEGVDCPGDILSSLIIVRLPFPQRSHALNSKLEQVGCTKDFVNLYAIPQMIIKLRQGAGRLIRTETDTGVLSILDARAAEKGKYHDRVMKALAKYPPVFSVKEVAEYIDSVKDCSYRGEVAP